MSNDNLLAALTGALEGAVSVAVPFAQKRYQTNLELELARAKQPLELEKYRQEQRIGTEESVRQQQLLNPLQISKAVEEKRQILPMEEASKIKVLKSAQENQVPIIDSEGNVVGYTKRGAVKLPAPKENKNQKDIALLKSTRRSFQDLMKTYREARGGSGTLSSGLKSLASTVTRGAYDPSAKVYNDRKREFVQTANKQLTGSSRSTQQAISAAVNSIPEFFESPEAASMKEQQFYNLLDPRIEEFGGTVDEENNTNPSTPLSIGQPVSGKTRKGLSYTIEP